ncbi:hypothetical protein D9756_011390 [Leucocoprinus leucothites]|uniref:Nephrocystin 3-like N-terminal domain-containing protein n=1 Tax=Leucocoprinus leucothites TaxID=201217 RepID=A0A8H5CTJ9_9AGAR|nr:hypothetical protein D9756_011390 [Leucoagaricus leucothites]
MPQNARKLPPSLEEFSVPSRRAADPNGAGSQSRVSAPQRPPLPLSTQDTISLSQRATTTPTLRPVFPPSLISTSVPPGIDPPNLAPIFTPSPALVPSSHTLFPPSLSSAYSQRLQQFNAREMFQNAQGFTINNPQFIDTSHAGSGLERLLKYSMPDAFYDSGARYPPPKCHLGTRNEHIELITNWGLGNSDLKKPILSMHGSFGTGKTAIAQSCAEVLVPIDKLAATLFFSHSNADRDDPRRVFTSIAFQIATICPSFGEIVSKCMIEHPALVTKSLSAQFELLLVQPLGQVDIAGSGLDGRVVIIDGLDECRGTVEQCEIIKIIATSVDKHTTPFRWFITSRPEGPILRTMNSPAVSLVCSRIELPISRAIDHEILVYLIHEFEIIREDHGLPESWPSEDVFAFLVERGAGLWIYVVTMVHFVKDENSPGPEDQLRLVIEFAKEASAKVGPDNPLAEMDIFSTLITERLSLKVRPDNPLAEMDIFYTLVMQQLPLQVRPMIQRILLAGDEISFIPSRLAGALCLSAEQLRHALAFIQPVVEVQGSDLNSMDINFYHKSFFDFMKDPQRSKELCIYGDFLIGYRWELLEWLHEVCSRSADFKHFVFPSGTVLPAGVSSVDHYCHTLCLFWALCGVHDHPLDVQTAMSLAKLPFQKMLRLQHGIRDWTMIACDIRDNCLQLPYELHDKIIHKGKCPLLGCTNTEDIWILGHGENVTIPYPSIVGFMFEDNQDPYPGDCFCGAKIQQVEKVKPVKSTRLTRFFWNS